MFFRIDERLHPFSHTPGTVCLLPLTSWELQIFPTRICFRNLQSQQKQHILSLNIQGPVKDFTLELDLERLQVRVYGFSLQGYFCYRLIKEKEGIMISLDKFPSTFLTASLDDQSFQLYKAAKKTLSIPVATEKLSDTQEQLSLGMHKAQDWDLIKRRSDLKEIFPIWFRLAALTPSIHSPKAREGTLRLIDECREAIDQKNKEDLVECFLKIFATAFQGILSPRLQDEEFLGILPPPREQIEGSPLCILTESIPLIRRLFFESHGNQIAFLPCLPPEFHAGRFLGLSYDEDCIDIEWSKKLLKKVIWHSKQEREIYLILQKPLKTFRLRRSLKERGMRLSIEEPLFLKKDQRIYLDRFEK